MDNEKKNVPEEKPQYEKVEWFGVDGALVLLFIVLACIYGYGMLNGVDFIIGIMAPGVAIVFTVAIFLKYCTEVVSFATGKKGKEKETKEKEEKKD